MITNLFTDGELIWIVTLSLAGVPFSIPSKGITVQFHISLKLVFALPNT
jgi:hypothetical protein